MPEQNKTTINDLISTITQRIIALEKMTMNDLRMTATTDTQATTHSTKQEFLGNTKGQLIEAIISDEFLTEFEIEIPIKIDTHALSARHHCGNRITETE